MAPLRSVLYANASFFQFESSLVRRSGEQSARAAAPLAAAGLKIEFGEIPPPASRYGAWKMF